MCVVYSILQKKINQHKSKLKYIYMLIALFSCFMTLSQLSITQQVSESIRIFCYILCFVSIMKLDTEADKVGAVFDKSWKKILLFLLEVYGTLTITGLYFLPSTVTYAIEYPVIIYFILSFCWIWPIIRFLLTFLIKIGDSVVLFEHKSGLCHRIVLIAGIMIPCIIFLIAFNPAIISKDSEYCFYMAHHIWKSDVSMQDWQPPFYIFVLSLLIRICDSASFLIILQSFCFALVFVEGIIFLYKCGFSKKILSVFYLFVAFGVSNVIQLVTLWKDIPFMISILWLTLLLMKIVMKRDEYVDKSRWYIQIFFAVIFTAFFRQNGILPALTIVIVLPIVLRFSKKSIVTSIVCVLMILAIKGPLYNAMGVESMPQLKFFSLANDIMFSYYSERPVSEEAMEMINKITRDNPENFQYSAYSVKYNPKEPSGYSVVEFIKIYCENLIHNPMEAFMAIVTRNSDIWSIIKPYDEPVSCVNYLEESNIYSYNILPIRVNNILTDKLTNICYWIRSNSVLYLIYWRTGIYNLLIICLGIMTYCSMRKQRIMYMLPYTPILINLAALFISSGWTDYRYFWPNMIISLFLLFYFFYNRRAQM